MNGNFKKHLQANLAQVLLAAVALTTGMHAGAQTYPYQDAKQPIDKRVADLVGRMTLEEKVEQMLNAAPAIPRLGVPAYDYWSEGLHGIARSGYATMFPQAIGMAATFDKELVGNMAETIGMEARAKYNQTMRDNIHARYFGLTVWSPNINIFRDPRWGRGQETYGEDPYLTSRMGVAFVEGLQGGDPKQPLAIATPKHFAVHSGPESERHRFDVTPSPHDLEDTYLPAFRATITEAHADSLMCAYNAIDGSPACANTMLLKDTLRKAWGFNGFITSDCGAIDDFYSPTGHKFSPDAEHASATAVLAGTDTECGTESYKSLVKAVKDGLLPSSAIDTAVTRLFTARFELGLFDGSNGEGVGKYGQVPMSTVDSAQHRALALKAARESMVLLKNDNATLPLDASKLKTIAVIGPNATSLIALEGNYNAQPSHPVLPLDGIAEEFSGAKVLYAQGSPYAEKVMLPVPRTAFHASDRSPMTGLTAEYFSSGDFSGKPVEHRTDKQIEFDWDAVAPASGLTRESYAVRWSGMITPPVAGDYKFSFTLGECYPCHDQELIKVYVDDKLVSTIDSHEPGDGRDTATPPFTVPFADNHEHLFRVEYVHKGLFGGGLTLNWLPPVDALRAEAVAAAQKADVVVAFVGLSSKLEGEEMPVHVEGFAGGDRTDIKLPAVQQAMLEAVASTGKPLVVVLMNGSALASDWQHAGAVLEAWYPGEAGGQAIAETLAGKNNPGGKLPLTFYASIDQLPRFTDYAMKGRTYRYFSGKPQYGFGYGLSYTTFAYDDVHVSTSNLKAGEPLGVDAVVRNTGRMAGDEVAELYLIPPSTELGPKLALRGFERVHLAPGASQRVHFELKPRDQSLVGADGVRSVQPGSYSVYVGGAQPDASSKAAAFTIIGSAPLPR
jgi:beta-glucosidase